jgi:uncharacterized membrane protein HdeD (DUF308 family)
LLLMCFLVLEGIVTVMLALEHWRHLSSRWGWMLASGLVDLSLAVFIVVGLPGTAPRALVTYHLTLDIFCRDLVMRARG